VTASPADFWSCSAEVSSVAVGDGLAVVDVLRDAEGEGCGFGSLQADVSIVAASATTANTLRLWIVI